MLTGVGEIYGKKPTADISFLQYPTNNAIDVRNLFLRIIARAEYIEHHDIIFLS